MIGQSDIMRRLDARLRRVAAFDSHVLITGETGTGKELAANAVHGHSRRAEKPLVAINCAAIPEHLIESELFGHDRGAFTGAVSAFPGRFKMADGGSVFLDEVAEMSELAQTKLLRAIETREAYRVGGRSVAFDVRFIAATHQDVDQAGHGPANLRRDLYFRLNVARIHLPPLRARSDDIPLLVAHFVRKLNQKYDRDVLGFTSDSLIALARYRWPGNVRELKNLVEGTFINSPARRFGRDDLPEPYNRILQAGRGQRDDEKRRLLELLLACNGNKVRVARQMNCSRMTVYRKLKKYDLDRRLGRLPALD